MDHQDAAAGIPEHWVAVDGADVPDAIAALRQKIDAADRAMRADAWDEGMRAGSLVNIVQGKVVPPINPYRNGAWLEREREAGS